MSWFNPNTWFKSPYQPNIYNPDGKLNADYFIGTGNNPYYFDLDCEEAYLRAYNECPPLKSVIGKRAKAFNNGVLELIKTDGTKTKGNYANDPWSKEFLLKLKQPNVLQSQDQFFAQQNTYIDIFGYCPVFIIRPSGFNSEITSIWNIPPWLFDITYTGKWLSQNTLEGIYKDYVINWVGGPLTLAKENLFFVFDDCIGTDSDSNLHIPDSRLLSLSYPVANIVSAYKSRNTLINHRGASGILTNDNKDQVGHIPLNPLEKESLQQDFTKYGLVGQKYQIIITSASMKWQPMALPTKDLMLFEEIVDDTNQILDAYSYPPELFASVSKGVTFENKKYAKKDLYSNTIIPEANSRIEQFSRGVIPKDKNVELRVDFSLIDVLQEEEKTKAEAEQAINLAAQTQYRAGLITKNDWREKLGLDRLPEDGFNEYYTEPEKETII